MAKINTFEYIELKKMIFEQFGINLSLESDSDKQCFKLDSTNELLIEFIKNYFFEKQIAVVFNEEKTTFTTESSELC